MPNNIEAALNELRLRLLNLTGRNRLVHFTHRPGSSLQFVHSMIGGTFNRLTEQNARVVITPLPKPDLNDWVNRDGRLVRPDPKEFAERCGINTSYTLDLDGQGWKTIAAPLQTLFFGEELGKHCRKLEREAKLAIEETGANQLYLVAGFLEFPAAPNSDKLYMAPLLCIPVSLSRSDTRPYPTFFLNHTGEEITDNLSLREKLRRDFGFNLPEFNLPEYDGEIDNSAENYLKTISDAVEAIPNWRVHRMMTLTLLSFTNMLLVRDLDPANWEQGGQFNSLVEHPLIKQIFEGNSAGGEPPYAPDYPIDDHQMGDLPLICDADSSQHSALIDVLEGHNRVIEGPPGTGKSQTITNLIAAALQRGKTILFVAEKLAALEVVKSRLTRADLAPYVLELHSNKTNKKDLLKDLDNRIKLPEPNAENLPDLLQRLEEKRRNLKAYADLMNTQIGNDLNLTLHQILWRAERHRMQSGNSAQAVQNIDHFAASRTNPVQFAEICDCLHHLVTQLGLIGIYGPEHPLWGFFPQELSPEQDLVVQRVLRDYAVKFAEFAKFSRMLTDWLGGSNINMGAQGTQNLLSLLDNLAPGDPLHVDFVLLPSLFSPDDPQGDRGLGVLRDLKDRIERIASLKTTRTHLLGHEPASEQLLEVTSKCLNVLSVLGMESLNKNALDEAVNILQGASTASQDSLGRIKSIADMAGLPFEGSLSDTQTVEAIVSVAASVRKELLDLRHEGLRQPLAVAKLFTAKMELNKNIDKIHILESIFYMDALPSENEISEAVQTLREGDAWYRIFQGHWRKALRVHKRLERNKGKKSAIDRLRGLELLLTAQNARANWNADIELQTVAGIHFRGEQTPLDQLYELAQWAEESRVTLESADVHSAVFDPYTVDRSVIVHLSQQKAIIDESMQAFSRFDSAIKGPLNRASPRVLNSLNAPLWNTRLQTLDRHISNIKIVSAFLAQHFRVDTSIKSGLAAVKASRDLPQLEQTLLAYKDAQDLLGDKFQGRNTNLEAALAAHAYGTLVKQANLPNSIKEILIADGCVENYALLTDYIKRINMGWQATIDFEKAMQSHGEFNLVNWADSSNQSAFEYGQQLVVKTQHAADNLGMLLAWTQYVATRTKAISLGLNEFVVKVENGDIEGGKLEHAFNYRFYAAIARGVFDTVPALRQFNGVQHSAMRQEYADLDKKIIQLRGKQVAICLRSSVPPSGHHGPGVNEMTEMRLLKHLIRQIRPRVPVRQIMRRAGKAIQALKPCFMMGPQSVAQFLEPGGLHFDIIVMDEASQLRPEQAIGAIARGSQLVVVGDPKQLPPTNFFSRMVIADGDGDGQVTGNLAVTDAESILDVCITHFHPVRTLRWHYRSRHESLIAFSNHHFYRGNLVVFPSPFPRGKSLGLSYQHVADGIYGDQVNHVEARRVVDAAVEHILLRPDDSLGIVTLNIKQRDLLAEMLDKRLSDLPQASDFKEKWEKEGMGLFIKNLENVQGDERDCIFISTTFGKTAGATVLRQNFGPISREGGWRRLNVLFTRARKSVVVFSSMLPEDIVSDDRTPEGTKALRNYLEFARTGLLPMKDGPGRPPDSDFEIAVIDVLRNNGYEVTPQLGVAGFRIDIAVKHPLHLSGYLAAIECDGASYHSGVSVRDRDRIRQEILESLGWRGRIWRIWSTDWFRNPIVEIGRMLQFLNRLREDPVPSEYVVAEDVQVPEVLIPAHAPRQLELFPEENEATEGVVFDEDEELETNVGDLVGYAPLDAPDTIIYVQLTAGQTNPEMGLVAETTPLGSILMGVTVGEIVVLRVPGRDSQSFMVKSIKRQAVRSGLI